MVNGKDIHSDFTEELAKDWQKEGFSFEETKKGVDKGFKPNEYDLVIFIKGSLGYSDANSFYNMEIERLRSMYGENLREQEKIIRETTESNDLQLQEALELSLTGIKDEGIDKGGLTDDNIIYILENDEIIKEARNVQVKKDIANIYLQVEKTKQGEVIDEEFGNSLKLNKKYILLPLRVHGNHWSLLLFINNEYSGKAQGIYYISSLEQSLVNDEIKEISIFLKQIGEKFGDYNNSIINKNNLSEMVFKTNPKQPNSWDCGVYICEFIKFLCVDQYYNLNEENFQITPQRVKKFRDEWKKKIGEEKWCKGDNSSEKSKTIEMEELEKALILSLEHQVPTSENEKDKLITDLSKKIIELKKELNKVKQELREEKIKNQTRELIAIKSKYGN